MNPTDRDLAKRIRSAIVDDKSLSTYAHNIRFIAQDGKVTLKGPVRSEEEKSAIEAKATEVAGAGNVINQLKWRQLSLNCKSQGEENGREEDGSVWDLLESRSSRAGSGCAGECRFQHRLTFGAVAGKPCNRAIARKKRLKPRKALQRAEERARC